MFVQPTAYFWRKRLKITLRHNQRLLYGAGRFLQLVRQEKVLGVTNRALLLITQDCSTISSHSSPVRIAPISFTRSFTDANPISSSSSSSQLPSCRHHSVSVRQLYSNTYAKILGATHLHRPAVHRPLLRSPLAASYPTSSTPVRSLGDHLHHAKLQGVRDGTFKSAVAFTPNFLNERKCSPRPSCVRKYLSLASLATAMDALACRGRLLTFT